ncbi:hypothetical protein E8E13_000514 [Curvularia kusanoi]|uniref:Zn(2)-C6 fungal-type domain-containing protein n=1 Tax=Curvularia kusanoi TaxID=90978 RepID=A0A9P4T468_CURKU|nr:hypothetical protein E8E13_000514 [Curvularia kusanoi]
MASGTKRMSDDDAGLTNTTKIQRVEHHHGHGLSAAHQASTSPHQRLHTANNDFSGSVKRKLADSKRTGQACDRCKIRKIRCDGRPEGCTPCEQNRTQCCTTDRITGKATVRGHAEAMETENQYLRTHLADLQAQLKDMGVEPRPPPAYSNMPWPPVAPAAPPQDAQDWSSAQRRPSASPLAAAAAAYAPAGDKADMHGLPQFKFGSIGDNYLGVASGDVLLSHIRGTSLSVFGHEIDISDFGQDGAEYENSPMSYQTLVRVTMGNQHVDPAPLPPYEALREWATWYLRSLNPYTMLVHKPAFMDLIWRFGNDPNFTPSAPENVMVHMMLATIKYQIAARNSQQSSLMDESHAHYMYAASLYREVILGRHELADVQALAMISHHLRNFPKPGAAWIFTSLTYQFSLERGLHRSVKNWPESGKKFTELEIEMRKRIFWTIHALTMNLAGKLGRPMPISNDEMDVEFPEPLNDCLPGEEATLSPFHQCSFQVGIQIAKYTVWELDLYKTIYAVRSSQRSYMGSLQRLEAGIRKWKEELPYELRDASRAEPDDHIFALYLEYWYQEFQLLLHHPSVCRSADLTILSSNLDKCAEASQKMLHNCVEMMHKKSLDIVWINTVVYIAALFTTLYSSSRRKDSLTPVDMTRLKSDMATWLSILGECSQLSGNGDKMKRRISSIVDQALDTINDSIVKRTATESLARVAMHTKHQPNTSSAVYDTSGYNEQQYTTTSTSPTEPVLNQGSGHNHTHLSDGGNITLPYGLNTQIPASQQASTYDHQPYIKVDEDSSLNTPANTYAYHQTSPQVSNSQQSAYVANSYNPQDWRQWSQTYMQQPVGPTGEYLNTATTLMALGGRDGTNWAGEAEEADAISPDENEEPADDEYSYSSSVLFEESTQWLAKCRALCFDPETGAVFISGVGYYDDCGFFEVCEPGDDPYDTQPRAYQCYEEFPSDWAVGTFPFHEACYRMLAERLGYDNPKEIDKHALLTVMRKYHNSAYNLGLDYGGVETDDQSWMTRRGEEYLVCDPEEIGPESIETILGLVPHKVLHAEPVPDFSYRIKNDSFSSLPVELLHMILSLVPAHDALNLMKASQHVCAVTREPYYWTKMIAKHLVPWFRGVESLDAEQDNVDYKALFLFLDAATQPRKGLTGPWMALANRRRIWGVCGQLVDAYTEALEQELAVRGVMSDEEGDGDVAGDLGCQRASRCLVQ